MKRILIFFLFSTILISCKSTNSVVNTKLDNKKERILKGNWVISNVSFPGSEYLNVKSFNIEDSKCFIGSKWSFISNNNEGEMTLSNPSTNCKEFSSPITWFINKDGDFALKFINNYKAKEVSNGYVLKINNITETSFNLVDKINVAGQVQDITYTFQKK